MPAMNTTTSTQFAIAIGTSELGNASARVATATMFTRAIGIRPFQQKLMSWSIRRRGKVARIHIVTTMNAYTFSVNQDPKERDRVDPGTLPTPEPQRGEDGA